MAEPEKQPQLMSVKDVAALWGVNTRTVLRWVQLRRLRALRIGGSIRFQRSDVISAASKYRYGAPKREDPLMG